PELREKLGPLIESLARLGTAVVDAFTPVIDKVLPAIETILGLGLDGATSVVDYIAGLVETFNTSGIGGVWDKVATDWQSAGPVLAGALDTAWASVTTWVSDRAAEVPGLFGSLADGATDGFDKALN